MRSSTIMLCFSRLPLIWIKWKNFENRFIVWWSHECSKIKGLPLTFCGRRVQLRKAERRNEDLKVDCEELEEQISQMSAELRHAHDDLRRLAAVDDELATAKHISIKLHDECERLNTQCQLYRLQLDDTVSTEASLRSASSLVQVYTS